MEYRKRIVLVTALFLVAISILSVTLYPVLPSTLQVTFFFYLLVVSAWTSLAGCFWALFSVWKFHKVIDETRSEIDAKLHQHYSPFYSLYEHLRDRYDAMPPERREVMAERIEQMADRLVERLTAKPFKPEGEKEKR